ncbi:MAG: rhodanese-like domain-containing protein [Candidatus Electrothrix aestuarii]|jgi:rhodanese-related sulfurtransferase|uniref:Rhodanese-like domain-containing protein n=1 Tax=Candidatus Electrothrix aestuarii TaxID=3062594 RepID=A0AAU8M118_9BACT|nr:rhodanese-like domain-containing protein [Candidatus Electrothrix aestuarii]WPD23858.1 MAG: rhodanese-like domain-containing protein [Candidatus Electrothrix sp. GW3-3]
MNRKKISLLIAMSACFISQPFLSFASSLQDGEKAVAAELKAAIPEEKIKTVDDLYAKWKEMEEGKSNAVIIDIRTASEFESGHIQDSNNVDSGHAYTMPKKIDDPNAEIWVFCRTQHRATYFTGMLYKYGYKNVYLAAGGIKAWAEKGYPLVTKYLGNINVNGYKKKMDEKFQFRENG